LLDISHASGAPPRNAPFNEDLFGRNIGAAITQCRSGVVAGRAGRRIDLMVTQGVDYGGTISKGPPFERPLQRAGNMLRKIGRDAAHDDTGFIRILHFH
jgi:hypothetical protein